MGKGETAGIEKIVAMYTSRDKAISECGLEAAAAVRRAGSFAQLLASHIMAWKFLWRRFEINIELKKPESADRQDTILKLYTFHLLQTTSVHSKDLDVGVPSRGWHGEAYRGHIFWDELFIFPLLNFRMPEITRALLLYRYRRLGQARIEAREQGRRGAMYPWQSRSNGREESQRIHLNPRSGRWLPDNSYLQRHVNAAIAYNIWLYYKVTDDMEFISSYGAEMFLAIALFLNSVAEYNKKSKRYEIRGVMGPDEYHEKYPGSDSQGLNNNAYTNVMTVWVLMRALDILELLDEEREKQLLEQLDITDQDRKRWKDITEKMYVPFHDQGIISQFEGYDRLEEFDWEGYGKKYDDIQRLDRILEAEGKSPNRYKVSKQADVLMLFYLLSSEELKSLFEKMGYVFTYDTIPKNINYYLQRTSHGSTLSRVVHSWVLARSDRERSWRLFNQALQSDVADIQGGTTPEGIHLGVMAGTVDLVQRCYTDINARGDILWFSPLLPSHIRQVDLVIRYRAHSLSIRLMSKKMTVTAFKSSAGPIKIGYKNRVFTLQAGQTKEFKML
jgi:alpha,alpha-trehalase